MASCSLEFVSVGCNRIAHCIKWATGDIVAFAAHSFIGLWDVKARETGKLQYFVVIMRKYRRTLSRHYQDTKDALTKLHGSKYQVRH